MTNTNNVQNLINEVMATRGATVRVFGQPYEVPTDFTGQVDIIEILESFKGYETDIDLPAPDEIEYNEELEVYEIMDSEGEVIESHLDTIEEAQERFEELSTSTNTVDAYLEFMEELDAIEEKQANNSYNWAANVSNHYDYRVYHNEGLDVYYVEFKVHLFGDVRGNYTDSVLLEFDNDYTFHELLHEADGYEEYKGYGIRFSATHEAYEIWNLETDHSADDKYAWEDVIEYIDELAAEEA